MLDPFRFGFQRQSEMKFSPVHMMPDSLSFSVHKTTLRSVPPTGPQQCLLLKQRMRLRAGSISWHKKSLHIIKKGSSAQACQIHALTRAQKQSDMKSDPKRYESGIV